MTPSDPDFSTRQQSRSDLQLVLAAAKIVSAVRKNDEIQTDKASWNEANQIIKQKGYDYDTSLKTAPTNYEGQGIYGPISAVTLIPKDSSEPIVVAFRGTDFNQGSDLKADISIAMGGVAHDYYRDNAYRFYQDVMLKYSGRAVVLTGHSLGGNLAQDVALRALNEAFKNDSSLPNQKSKLERLIRHLLNLCTMKSFAKNQKY